MKVFKSKIKEPSWEEISFVVEKFGWFTERIDKNRFVLERGRQRIVARKLPSDNWKVEYFEGKNLDDMAGVAEQADAKREVVEMVICKTPFAGES